MSEGRDATPNDNGNGNGAEGKKFPYPGIPTTCDGKLIGTLASDVAEHLKLVQQP